MTKYKKFSKQDIAKIILYFNRELYAFEQQLDLLMQHHRAKQSAKRLKKFVVNPPSE